MCQYSNHRHSIFCILPPYVLRSIAQRGTDAQRIAATQTMASDTTFRAMRAGSRITADLSQNQPAALTVEGQKQRTIYTANNTQDLPGVVLRAEGDGAHADPAVNEAYDGLGHTYDFFWEVFNRNSIDDDGLPLNGIVHFGREYNNAFWDGQRMVFGDGDGDLFNRFTISLDVIGHELTHGVTEDEAQLIYFYQSGALNESLSDVFGSLVKQRVLNQTADQADWLIGAGLLTDQVQGTGGNPAALRSMSNPGSAFDDPVLGRDPQPGHMDNYVQTFEDNGGVHINSGIPNRAFYLVATNLGGYAWERAGRIWYEALRDPRLKPNAKFRRFAQLTVHAAQRLFPDDLTVRDAVIDAWNQVGITIV